jgi:two-component system, OmpR family, alkaline phosphatase synthesis response regulator PhoP
MPKVLIVDDEPHIRLLLEEALEEFEDEGVELLFAEDGAEALEIILEHRPELVFLDVMLPTVNGYEVCSRVKTGFGMTDVYIVMLTAKGQEFDKKRGLEVGADIYMTKPFNPMALKQKAREVLGL